MMKRNTWKGALVAALLVLAALLAIGGLLYPGARPASTPPADAVRTALAHLHPGTPPSGAAPSGAAPSGAAPSEAALSEAAAPAGRETATFAGGCFWCLEPIFESLRGVDAVDPGYTGGTTADPTYDAVATGATGHAEAVRIVFDPAVITYGDLLDVFFSIHDPTTLDRQGADVGSQYRSAVFYHTSAQLDRARAALAAAALRWPAPIVTRLEPAGRFYVAEPDHHDYFRRYPDRAYCRRVIEPKVARFRREHLARLRNP